MRTLIAATIVAMSNGGAMAQDTNFAGFYLEIYAGSTNVSYDFGSAVGGVAGYRLTFSERFVLGLEGQAGYGDIKNPFGEAFLLGQAGVIVTDQTMLFAEGGVGARFSPFSPGTFALGLLGGGLEVATSDTIHIRGSIAALFTDERYVYESFPNVRVNVGVIVEMN